MAEEQIQYKFGGDASGYKRAAAEVAAEQARLSQLQIQSARASGAAESVVVGFQRQQELQLRRSWELRRQAADLQVKATGDETVAAREALRIEQEKVALVARRAAEQRQAAAQELEAAKAHAAEIDQLGDKYLKVGAVAAAASGYAVKQFATFDASMAFTKARITDPESMGALRKKALELGNDERFAQLSAADVGKGFGTLAQSGFTGRQIAGGLGEATAAAAVAGQTDTASAAQLVADAMMTFKAKAGDAPKIIDEIAASSMKGGVSFQQMSEALKMGGSALSALSKGSTESLATLALLSKHMLRGSDAGTALKTFLLNLGGASEEGAQKMKLLGINLFDANGKAKSMGDIAETLRQKLGNLSEQQQIAALKTMFGADAFRVAQALMSEGRAGVEQYAQATARQGAASDLAKAQNDSLAGSFEALKSNVETVATGIGEGIGTVLRPLAGALSTVVGWVGAFDEYLGHVPGTIFGLTAAILLMRGAYLKLQAGIALARIAKEAMMVATAKATVGAGAEAVAQGTLATAYAATATAAKAAGRAALALLANPAFLAIAGTVAVIAGYWMWVKRETDKAQQGVENYNSALDELVAKGQMSQADAAKNKSSDAPGVWDNILSVFGYETEKKKAFEASMGRGIVGLKKAPKTAGAAKAAAGPAPADPAQQLTAAEADLKLGQAKLELVKAQGGGYDQVRAALTDQAAKEDAILAIKARQVELETEPHAKAAKLVELEAERTKLAADRITRERAAAVEQMQKEQSVAQASEGLAAAKVAHARETGQSYAEIAALTARQRAEEDNVFAKRQAQVALEPDSLKRQAAITELEKDRLSAATRRHQEDKQNAQEQLAMQRQMLQAQADLAASATNYWRAAGYTGRRLDRSFEAEIQAKKAANDREYYDRMEEVKGYSEYRLQAEKRLALQKWQTKNTQIEGERVGRRRQQFTGDVQSGLSFWQAEAQALRAVGEAAGKLSQQRSGEWGVAGEPQSWKDRSIGASDVYFRQRYAQAMDAKAHGDEWAEHMYKTEYNQELARRMEEEARREAEKRAGMLAFYQAQVAADDAHLTAAREDHLGLVKILELQRERVAHQKLELSLERQIAEQRFRETQNAQEFAATMLRLKEREEAIRRTAAKDAEQARRDELDYRIRLATAQRDLAKDKHSAAAQAKAQAELEAALAEKLALEQGRGSKGALEAVEAERALLREKRAGAGGDELRAAIIGGNRNAIEAILQRARGAGAGGVTDVGDLRRPQLGDLPARIKDVMKQRDERIADEIIDALKVA